jgi:hypothetical protein
MTTNNNLTLPLSAPSSSRVGDSASKPFRKFSILGPTFLRRPISEPPENETYCFVDSGVGGGWTDREAALFEDCAWTKPNGKQLRFVPAFWTVLDHG